MSESAELKRQVAELQDQLNAYNTVIEKYKSVSFEGKENNELKAKPISERQEDDKSSDVSFFESKGRTCFLICLLLLVLTLGMNMLAYARNQDQEARIMTLEHEIEDLTRRLEIQVDLRKMKIKEVAPLEQKNKELSKEVGQLGEIQFPIFVTADDIYVADQYGEAFNEHVEDIKESIVNVLSTPYTFRYKNFAKLG